jgi:RNA polymerase sigma factor (TIGR02999 family)
MATPAHEVTRILQAASLGDKVAADRLLPLVYDELRALAAGVLRGQRKGHTLEPTALVHEAYLKLVDQTAPWEGRSHFFGVAAKAMRSILVDHARARKAEKRGGARERVPLDAAVVWFEERSLDLLALDEALERLAALDPAAARLVELRFFAGLTIEETARTLGVSTATVERDWALTRAWLHRELTKGEPPA